MGSRLGRILRALRSAGNSAAHAFAALQLALMRRSREEEVAVGYNMIATCLMAGAIMAVAKPIANWLTGNMLDNPPVPELGTMVNRIFDLVMYLGVVILVVGLIMAGINLVRRPKIRKK